MFKVLVYASLALSIAACAHKQTQFDQGSMASNGDGDKGVQAALEWVKNKKESIDLNVRIKNGTDNPIRIYSSDITLNYGGEKLSPRQSGDLRISSGVRSQATLVYMIGKNKPMSGPADLTITPYDQNDKALAPVKLHFDVNEK